MATGTVKSVTDKGYGFISTPDSKDKDVFYHESSLTGELATRKLRMGDKVVFNITRNDRGLNASDIRLADSEEAPKNEDSASDSSSDDVQVETSEE